MTCAARFPRIRAAHTAALFHPDAHRRADVAANNDVVGAAAISNTLVTIISNIVPLVDTLGDYVGLEWRLTSRWRWDSFALFVPPSGAAHWACRAIGPAGRWSTTPR
ncbi:MAG: hypothetical protein IPH82_15550 [Chloroflexi bacterium]|nr:hypothetical protein [Chloroflexota bacterium]